ncbi:hypothetical protein [Clostridium tyrobutyricum]|uniref:hypothetical protein n=1 Tax=Clostridium tyrobutyricum TaxID=1519 RepID=UPI001C39288F|nr:hypothetical protein [Clostridium tyrobutyricum]MBV4415136.1 hypothetical protein [Clostridium tyrobutyricum]
MLDTATVTLSYSEFESLIRKAKATEHSEKTILELEKELEDKPERKALDDISDILIKAINSKTLKEKQVCIKESLEIYCKTFDMSMDELF